MFPQLSKRVRDNLGMARRGRPTAELILSEEERETLTRWARRPTSSQQLALRARIVLACADGATNTEVAAQLRVARPTVGKWRSRFVVDRLDGLVDEPRPGAPRTITDEQVERVVVDTLETTPRDATHWSRASMAAHSGLSRSTVGRIWKAFRLQPHRAETFKLSTDPLFIDKVRDVVGLYIDPPDRAIVLSVDEKSQVQALNRSAPVLPMMPGMPERATHDYLRHGVTSLFAALDVATGKVISSLHRRHRSTEFRKFLNKIDKQVPADLLGAHGRRGATRAAQRSRHPVHRTVCASAWQRTTPIAIPLHPHLGTTLWMAGSEAVDAWAGNRGQPVRGGWTSRCPPQLSTPNPHRPPIGPEPRPQPDAARHRRSRAPTGPVHTVHRTCPYYCLSFI